MDDRVSIFAVAQKAKCSIATVSNVLNNKGRVGAEKRRIVLRAAKSLGYQADSAARNLRLRKSETLGLLFYPSCAKIFRNPFYAEIMEGLEEGLSQKGYHLLLTGNPTAAHESSVPDFLISGKVDGMILLGGFPAKIMQEFCERPAPMLLLDSDAPWPVDSITTDGLTGEKDVVDRLAAHGHRNMLMIGYDIEDFNTDLRVEGFLTGLHQHGLPAGKKNVIRDWFSHDAIYKTVHDRLMGRDAPTAIVAANDSLAMAMIQRLRNDGISVPGQVSVVGFDDDMVMLDERPFLSTLRVEKKELGRIGAEMILKRVASPEIPTVKLRMPVTYIARESVGPARRSALKRNGRS